MPDSSRELRVALLGYGLAGRVFHFPLLSHVIGVRVSHVVSSKAKGADLPAVRITADANQIFSDHELDLVVIATPNDTHFDLAQRALRGGKNVVVDKPFTTTVEEARDLIALARQSQRLLSVFHNRRWDSDFLTVKDLLRKNVLGEVVQFESHFDRYRPQVQQRWRELPGAGTGVWFDLGSHLADQALQLFGPPEAIYADMAAQRKGATATDYFHVLMRYGSGRVILHAGSLVAAETPRFAVHGMLGSYTKFGLDPQEDALRRGDIPGRPGWGADPRDGELVTQKDATAHISKVPTLAGNYLAYYEGIRDAILKNAPNPVPAEEALQAMAVLETAVESAKQKSELPFKAVAVP
jgi:predicted dehydrogenase